jgi:L-rhamnose isomerase/sugar isomerase
MQFYQQWEQWMRDQGVDIDKIKDCIKSFNIETPSWGYANTGTRFYTFKEPGAARNIYEKLADAAIVNKLTGVCSSVAMSNPSDCTLDNIIDLKNTALELGLRIGAINPVLHKDNDYKLGSLCNADPKIRSKAVNVALESIEIAKKADATIISLWVPDGTNYPGQADFIDRKHWLYETLQTVYQQLGNNMRLLIEYKMFEPACYHTDLADWGMSFVLASKLGEKAQVLVDLGHHALGTNIEQIVAFLLDEGKIGGFHFNARRYADDDLIVGTSNPYELFLIFTQLVAAEQSEARSKTARDIAYMIDQSHHIENKVHAALRSVMNIQTAYAKALLVDRNALRETQIQGDVVGAERLMMEAFETDVKPLLEVVRQEMGLHPNPMVAYEESGYGKKIVATRL